MKEKSIVTALTVYALEELPDDYRRVVEAAKRGLCSLSENG